jgi:hypothetical protein
MRAVLAMVDLAEIVALVWAIISVDRRSARARLSSSSSMSRGFSRDDDDGTSDAIM